MTGSPPDDAARAAMLDAVCAIQGLVVAPAWRRDVLFHMRLIGEAARLLNDFSLDDDVEAAPIFHP